MLRAFEVYWPHNSNSVLELNACERLELEDGEAVRVGDRSHVGRFGLNIRVIRGPARITCHRKVVYGPGNSPASAGLYEVEFVDAGKMSCLHLAGCRSSSL